MRVAALRFNIDGASEPAGFARPPARLGDSNARTSHRPTAPPRPSSHWPAKPRPPRLPQTGSWAPLARPPPQPRLFAVRPASCESSGLSIRAEPQTLPRSTDCAHTVPTTLLAVVRCSVVYNLRPEICVSCPMFSHSNRGTCLDGDGLT